MRHVVSQYGIPIFVSSLATSALAAQASPKASSETTLEIEASRAQHEKEMLLGGAGFAITLVIIVLGYRLSSRFPAKEAVLLFLGLAVIAAAVLLGMFNTESINAFIPVLSGLGGILLGLAGGRLTAGGSDGPRPNDDGGDSTSVVV